MASVLFPTLFSTSDSKLLIGQISKLTLLLDLDVNTKLVENSTAGELATAGAGDTRDFTSDHESIDPWRPRGCAIFWLAKTNGTVEVLSLKRKRKNRIERRGANGSRSQPAEVQRRHILRNLPVSVHGCPFFKRVLASAFSRSIDSF